jgi:hypothetical protein
MSYRGSRSGFALEPRDSLPLRHMFAAEEVRSNSLNCDFPCSQILIDGEVNLPHRTVTNSFLYQIARYEQRAAGQGNARLAGIIRADLKVVLITVPASGAFAHIFSDGTTIAAITGS